MKKSLRTLKAVIVDDEPGMLSFLKQFLELRGYEVKAYGDPVYSPLYQSDGCPCLQQNECPDIIISDFSMPVVNGVELIGSFIDKGCCCKHIAMIAGDGFNEEDLARMAKYGTYFFTKPIDLAELRVWLDRAEYEISERST